MGVEFITLCLRQRHNPFSEIDLPYKKGQRCDIRRESDDLISCNVKSIVIIKYPLHQWRVICHVAQACTKGYQDETRSKTDERCPVSSNQFSGTQYCTWMWLITLRILLIWPDLTIIYYPTWKNQYRNYYDIISTLDDFFRMISSSSMRSKHCTPVEDVY